MTAREYRTVAAWLNDQIKHQARIVRSAHTKRNMLVLDALTEQRDRVVMQADALELVATREQIARYGGAR
jgi:hypothetical protein